MTVDISGFRALSDTRHVTGHAFGKSMEGVGSGLVDHYMTVEALFVRGLLQGGQICSRHLPWQRFIEMMGMGKVARKTCHSFLFVYGHLPIDVLLMMAPGKLVGVKVLLIAGRVRG